MILPLLQLAVVGAVGYCLASLRSAARRRSQQTWESLLLRLRHDWSARELSDQFLWKEGFSATQDEAWTRMEGPRGLWVMFHNAGIMIEMADYAARNSAQVDRLLVETLRSDAIQIRFCVLLALGQYAFSKASEGVRINAFRAAGMYTAMAARMTAFIQEHNAVILPDFVEAM